MRLTWVRKAVAFLAAVFISFIQLPYTDARQMSKAGQVFQDVQDGVVTVITSYTHGSGSLIDESGLVLTNNHVAKENKNHLRVKFGHNQVVEAKTVIVDRESDLAILWINLEKIKNYKALKPFQPENNDPLVLVGEEVIAMGSPVDKNTLARTMTTGIVSKTDEGTIRHDASINGGNSGGPLFNYDGNIVGVNTFGDNDRGPSIGGAIPISRAIPLIKTAKQMIEKMEKPSPELLPDIPRIAYPTGELLTNDPSSFTKRKGYQYNFTSPYFAFAVVTPPQGYHQMLKHEKKQLKKRIKRSSKKGFEVTDDEWQSKNYAFYNYRAPVVNIYVMPRPKLTTGSKVVNTLTFVAATGATVASMGIGAPLMFMPFVMGKHEVKKDFFRMSLVDESKKAVCVPIETGRIPYTPYIAQLTNSQYVELIDKSYTGLYTFDSKCFEKPNLRLVVDIEGTKDPDRSVSMPEKTRKLIVEDFKPYWSYVAKLNQKTAQVEITTKTIETENNLKEALPSASSSDNVTRALTSKPQNTK